MTERRGVALFLQLEANAIHAAGGIHGKHEGEIDRLAGLTLRSCGRGEEKDGQQREKAPGKGDFRNGAQSEHPLTLALPGTLPPQAGRESYAATRCMAAPA